MDAVQTTRRNHRVGVAATPDTLMTIVLTTYEHHPRHWMLVTTVQLSIIIAASISEEEEDNDSDNEKLRSVKATSFLTN